MKRNDSNSLGEINEILGRLTLFVQAYNVHVFLVAHPTKMKKEADGNYTVPSLYDVKGSGDFRDQAHNGLCVYRYFDSNNDVGCPHTMVLNLKTKFKHQGKIGESVNFNFCTENGRYKILDGGTDISSMVQLPEPLPVTGKELTNFELYNELDKADKKPVPF